MPFSLGSKNSKTQMGPYKTCSKEAGPLIKK